MLEIIKKYWEEKREVFYFIFGVLVGGILGRRFVLVGLLIGGSWLMWKNLKKKES